MHSVQWQAFLDQFKQLSQYQRLAGIDLLRNAASQDVAVTLTEQTAQASLHYPSCNSTRFHRHGEAHGLQLYRCGPCGKTYIALNSTPLAHLHHKT